MSSPARSGGPSDESGSAASGEESDPRSGLRPVAAVLLGLEALVLAVPATYSFLAVLSGTISAQLGMGLGAFMLLFVLALGLAARSILVRGRFGLGFGVTWQLFQALVGVTLLRGALYWQGGLALLLAILTFVLLTQLVRSTPLPGRDD